MRSSEPALDEGQAIDYEDVSNRGKISLDSARIWKRFNLKKIP
jgi:hypothetical protein